MPSGDLLEGRAPARPESKVKGQKTAIRDQKAEGREQKAEGKVKGITNDEWRMPIEKLPKQDIPRRPLY